MKAIIHIGMKKTGSTSIQTWFTLNRTSLEAEGVKAIGVRLIEHKPYTASTIALRNVACHVALREIEADEEFPRPEDWNFEKSESDYIVLSGIFEKLSRISGIFVYSNETLYNFTKLHIIGLDRFLARFFEDRTYVVYVRDSADFFASMYSQAVVNLNRKVGSIPFSETVDRCMREAVPFSPSSNFSNLLVWESVLGDRLCVRLLETDWLIKGDLIRDFASLIGVGAYKIPKIMNESLAAEYIEYGRELLINFDQSIRTNFRKPVMGTLLEASSGKPKLSVSDEQAKLIYEFRREEEERIRIRFFPDRSTLFSPKRRGGGVAPAPLTPLRKMEIESLIQNKIPRSIWRQFLQAQAVQRN